MSQKDARLIVPWKQNYTQLEIEAARAKLAQGIYAGLSPTIAAFDRLAQDVYVFEGAQKTIFKTLIFRDSPTYLIGLKQLQDDFNKTVTTLISRIRETGNQFPLIHPYIPALENRVNMMAADLNQAVFMATGNHDNGVALETLTQRELLSAIDLLREYREHFNTDHIATDTRKNRARIWIGHYCLEAEKRGIIGAEAQWKSCYRHLRDNQHAPAGDNQKAAWEYIQHMNPFTLAKNNPNRRRYMQEISDMKNEFKQFDETPDKLPTRGL